MEVVYEALGRNGPDCNNAITAAIEELEKMMAENNFEGLEGKVEKTLKGSLDWIPSPSPSVKIQIMGGKVYLR